MADQEQHRRRSQDNDQAEDLEIADERVDVEEIGDLLDEIDSVLEENAEEFVKNYVQKGGE